MNIEINNKVLGLIFDSSLLFPNFLNHHFVQLLVLIRVALDLHSNYEVAGTTEQDHDEYNDENRVA